MRLAPLCLASVQLTLQTARNVRTTLQCLSKDANLPHFKLRSNVFDLAGVQVLRKEHADRRTADWAADERKIAPDKLVDEGGVERETHTIVWPCDGAHGLHTCVFCTDGRAGVPAWRTCPATGRTSVNCLDLW